MQSSEIILQRARQLYEVNRTEQAIEELKKLLSNDPDNINALLLIIGCFINSDNNIEAMDYWEKLVQLAPDLSVTHYYHAIILNRLEKSNEAEESIREAIRIDPHDADYWGCLAAIHIARKEWKEALESATNGLEIEPENLICLNHRTLCLTKLNRTNEIDESISNTLSSNPYDSYTHANVGWSKLEMNDTEEAIEHFRESLRLNPTFEYAKEGLKEAIKSKNLIYRLFLNYSFWLSKQQSLLQWGFLLAIFFAQNSLPQPLSTILVVLVIISWVIEPLANFILLFNKDGKYLLTHRQKFGAITIGILISISLLGLILGTIFQIPDITIFVGYFGVLASLPIAGLTSSDKNFHTWWLKLLCFGLIGAGIVALGIVFYDLYYDKNNNEIFKNVWSIFNYGAILSTWFFSFRSK